MTISEMHHLFRVIGQAKGLQLVRAVLPESIDDYLNAAIMEKCRSVLIQNTSTAFPDKTTNRDNPTSPYNALRTLFKTKILNVVKQTFSKSFSAIDETNKSSVLAYLSVSTRYDKTITNGNISTIEEGNYYPCRIIEPDKISYILNDFCSKPSKEYPCCTIESSTTNSVEFKIYTNDNEIPKVVISYIATPTKVNHSANIDCDLPDYLHSEIVEIAVNKYFQSVGSTTKQVN